MSWCKCFVLGSVCGTVISLTLHTGDPRLQSVFASASLKMAQRRESSLKNHRRAFAPSLLPCPMAVSEIERERRENGCRRWRRRVLGLS